MTYTYTTNMLITIDGAENVEAARAVVNNIIDWIVNTSFDDNTVAGDMTWVPEFIAGGFLMEATEAYEGATDV
jgi:hypothetical protein